MRLINMKKIITLAYAYIACIFLSTYIYISLLSIRVINELDILFFKTILLLVLASCLTLFLSIYLSKKKLFIFRALTIWQDFALIFIVTFFINWFVYSLIPFNVSRSASIILLKALYDSNAPMSKSQLKDFVQDKYFNQYDAIGIRLNEQKNIGNIREINGMFFITPKGIFIANTFLFISNFYKLDNNFLDD
jgi:hypothetical protein